MPTAIYTHVQEVWVGICPHANNFPRQNGAYCINSIDTPVSLVFPSNSPGWCCFMYSRDPKTSLPPYPFAAHSSSPLNRPWSSQQTFSRILNASYLYVFPASPLLPSTPRPWQSPSITGWIVLAIMAMLRSSMIVVARCFAVSTKSLQTLLISTYLACGAQRITGYFDLRTPADCLFKSYT